MKARSALLLAVAALVAGACSDRPDNPPARDTPPAVDRPEGAQGAAPKRKEKPAYCPPDKRYEHWMCAECGLPRRHCRNDL